MRMLTCGCLRKATALEIMSSRSAPAPEPPVSSSFAMVARRCVRWGRMRSGVAQREGFDSKGRLETAKF